MTRISFAASAVRWVDAVQNRVKAQDLQPLAGGNTLALSLVNFHSLFIVEKHWLVDLYGTD